MDTETTTYEGFGGVRLVADLRGPADGWPVLFMHGGGQTRQAWGNAATVLAEGGWRTVSLDLRGHGDSSWAPNGDYSFTSFCADAVAVVDRLGRPPVLVGASLGGVAAMLAEGTSDRAVSSGLVIVDIAPRSNPEGLERIKNFMQSGADGFATLEEAAAAIAAYTPNRPKRVNPAGLMKVLRRQEDGRWHWHWDPAFMGRGRREVPPDNRRDLLELAVANIRVPALLVRGLLSDVVTDEGVDYFLSTVPGSRVVEIGGAAHMVAGDRNDAFATAVLEFLERDVRPTLAGRRAPGDPASHGATPDGA